MHQTPRKHRIAVIRGDGIDFVIVRENTEGDYSSLGGRMFAGTAREFAVQENVSVRKFHIDILCAHFVLHPDWFDVVVASNLFGDILSDLGPACAGTVGIAPSANINPDRTHPSLFEPVHGAAPDIADAVAHQPIH
jgi:isocitrate/isopropylmalate dehydrogenase